MQVERNIIRYTEGKTPKKLILWDLHGFSEPVCHLRKSKEKSQHRHLNRILRFALAVLPQPTIMLKSTKSTLHYPTLWRDSKLVKLSAFAIYEFLFRRLFSCIIPLFFSTKDIFYALCVSYAKRWVCGSSACDALCKNKLGKDFIKYAFAIGIFVFPYGVVLIVVLPFRKVM